MPITNEKMPAKKLVLFFVVDTSGSMSGSKIGALNNAVEEVIPMLGEISEDNMDAIIEIAVLKFDNVATWSYPNPVPAEGFSWRTLGTTGLTALGDACSKLTDKLTRSQGGFMSSASGSFAPVFIILSDGNPTDSYQNPLQKLKENNWFKAGVKIAIAIGDDANLTVLEEFTSSKEAVFTVHNIESLKKIIRCVSVTSSTVASKTTDSSDQTKQKTVEGDIKNELSEEIEKGEITPATGGNSIDDDWE